MLRARLCGLLSLFPQVVTDADVVAPAFPRSGLSHSDFVLCINSAIGIIGATEGSVCDLEIGIGTLSNGLRPRVNEEVHGRSLHFGWST